MSFEQDPERVNPARVRLAPLSEPDYPAIQLWKSDHRLSKLLLATPVKLSLDEVKQWSDQNSQDANQIFLGIYTAQANGLVDELLDKTADKMIGLARLMFINWQHRYAELGIYLGDQSYRGHGYGEAALRQLLQHGFAERGLNCIWLKVAQSNQPAIRLYERVGFKPEGIQRQRYWNGLNFEDLLQMSILADDFYG